MPLKIVTPEQFKTGVWYTIDPGVHTAIQRWDAGELCNFIVIDSTKMKSVGHKIDLITGKMEYFMNDIPGGVLIEGVDFRMGSDVSMASAARGNLSLLAYIVGGIISTCIYCDCFVHDPVRYVEWAGQLSYSQLRRILLVKFKVDCTNEHIAAARGIGFAARGDL